MENLENHPDPAVLAQLSAFIERAEQARVARLEGRAEGQLAALEALKDVQAKRRRLRENVEKVRLERLERLQRERPTGTMDHLASLLRGPQNGS